MHTTLDAAAAARFAALALKCLHQEYPNHISHTLASDADVRAPRALTPAFYGCYDWHSDVHGHWLLVRLVRLFPGCGIRRAGAGGARAHASPRRTSPPRSTYLQGAGRASFERPYGLAWLLRLAAELRAWDDPDARRWRATLAPLETEAATRTGELAARNCITRSGSANTIRPPSRSASSGTGRPLRRIRACARCCRMRRSASISRTATVPLAYEPSGEDFLSPCLAEADFMRRAAGAAEVRRVAVAIPAADPEKGRGVAHARGGDRSLRPEARPHRRPQPQSRLDARRHRARTAGNRSAPARAPECVPTARRVGAAVRDRRALRRRSLARHVCGLSDE